ncbi:MAG: sulfatase [Gemmatimonadota bacterium]
MAPNAHRSSSTARGRLSLLLEQLLLWVAAAVVAGFLQLFVARSLRLGFSIFRWGWESRDLVWRVPLGYVIVFAPVAVVLLALTLVLGNRWPRRVTLWTWCTLICFALLLLFPQIQGYASLVLACGIALPLSGLLARRERVVRTASAALAIGGGALVVGLSLWLPRHRVAQERLAIASLPPAPDGAPNVLLIILDTVRADYLSLYGATEETTPNLVRWAQQATVFDQAYSTAPWTTPSHASLFTGQYPSVHGASFTTALSPDHRTLADVLQEHGWATGAFTANFVATRFESGLAQGFLRYDDLMNTFEEVAKSTTITQSDNVQLFWSAWEEGRGWKTAVKRLFRADFSPHFTEKSHDDKRADQVRQEFTRWADALPAGRPFFAFLNFFDSHAPYRPPEPYYSMFKSPPRTVDRYRGGIRFIDDQLDSLFRGLEQRGALENTIVIVTADHGEHFGEHGQEAHGNSLYRQLLHVPLFVMYPRKVPSGMRVKTQVSGVDMAATVLDLTSIPQDSAIGGRSFAPLWRDTTARASDVIAEVDQNTRPQLQFKNALGPMKAYVDDSVHVMRDGAGIFEAYRYRNDPMETADLVAARRDSMLFAATLQGLVRQHSLVWPRALPRAKPSPADSTRDP